MKYCLFLISAVLMVGIYALSFAASTRAKPKIGVIVVDIQGDFTTWKKGSLAVPGTDKAFIDNVKKATAGLKKKGNAMFATQDWHPADHISFFTNHPGKKPFEVIQIDGRTQVLWPPHCIQNTQNAKVLVDNKLFKAIVKKGKDKRFDSYSGFQDDGGAKTELDSLLKKQGIKEVIVYGIATDYCVKATAMDAVAAGYKVTVIEDLCKGVAPDTTTKALEEMKEKGIKIERELKI
jgi:nicotinamidase/pyrazinamidase